MFMLSKNIITPELVHNFNIMVLGYRNIKVHEMADSTVTSELDQ